MTLAISGATVRGDLYPPSQVDMLTQDMLEVELPGQVFVDVGWFPEHDPNGMYVITVFYREFDNQLIPPQETRYYQDALSAVFVLAGRFQKPVSQVSGSATTQLTIGSVPSAA